MMFPGVHFCIWGCSIVSVDLPGRGTGEWQHTGRASWTPWCLFDRWAHLALERLSSHYPCLKYGEIMRNPQRYCGSTISRVCIKLAACQHHSASEVGEFTAVSPFFEKLYSFVGSTLGKPLTHNAGRLLHLITPYLRYPPGIVGWGG